MPVGAPIAVVGEAGEALPERALPRRGAADGARRPPAARPRPLAAAARHGRRGAARPADGRKASPLARRIAAERSVDLGALAGSGPHGRVIRADVERAAAAATARGRRRGASGSVPAAGRAPPWATADGEASRQGRVDVHELTRMQRTVARRMAESRATVPDIELRSEVDMAAAAALRERLRESPTPAVSQRLDRQGARHSRCASSRASTAPTATPSFETLLAGQHRDRRGRRGRARRADDLRRRHQVAGRDRPHRSRRSPRGFVTARSRRPSSPAARSRSRTSGCTASTASRR